MPIIETSAGVIALVDVLSGVIAKAISRSQVGHVVTADEIKADCFKRIAERPDADQLFAEDQGIPLTVAEAEAVAAKIVDGAKAVEVAMAEAPALVGDQNDSPAPPTGDQNP